MPLNILGDPAAAPFAGNAFLPAAALIPLRQHSGEEARPALAPGVRVREGQVIGLPSRQNSAYVYSSIPGILHGYYTARLADGTEGAAALIELAGALELTGRTSAPRPLDGLEGDALLSMIEDYGILHSFEETYSPLATLIREFKAALADEGGATLALRLFDFDPSCCADRFLAKTCEDAVLGGAALIAKTIGAKRVFLLYPNKKALPAGEAAASGPFEGMDVRRAASTGVYPSWAEHFCKKAAASAFGEGCDEKGVFCISPWTAYTAFNALKYAMPVLQRPVLVAGSAIRAPQMLNVRIGTTIRDIAEQCGGFKFPPSKVVAGGLIVGKAITDLDAPIDTKTSAVHFLGGRETRDYRAQRCSHCGRCLRLCPFHIDPAIVAIILQEAGGGADLSEESAARLAGMNIAKCIFCGACSAACPAGIPLHHIIKDAAAALSRLEGSGGGQN